MKKKKLLSRVILCLVFAITSTLFAQNDLYSEDLSGSEDLTALLPPGSRSITTKLHDEFVSADEKEDFELLEPSKKVEFAAWYGVTFGDNENQNGIRRLDIKYEPSQGTQLFMFYDNALAFDNIAIANLERIAPIVGVGAKHDWTKEWFTKVELGRRFLTTQDDQHLFNMENGYFFSSKFLGKLITQYDIRQDDNLFTVGAFIDFEVVDRFRIETGLFHAENLTFSETFNERFMLVPKLRLGRTEWVLGAYYDRYRTEATSLDQFSGGYSLFIFPIMGDLKGNLFFNYDKGFSNEITVLSFGLNQKI